MRIGAYRFRPGLWPTLATALLLPILLSLGFWQLERAGEKREFLESLERGRQAPPIQLNSEQPTLAEARHRSVEARGRYAREHQFLLENQIRDGRPGYLVLTPLQLEGTDTAVLVDRGWVPAPGDRMRLPDVEVPAGFIEVEGVLDRGPSIGLRLGEPATGTGWPRRLQYLDYGYLGDALPYRVLPYLVRLDPSATGGFRRDWQPVTPMGPQTHRGYAAQWFGLAAALVVIYLVVNIKRGAGRD